MRTAVGAVAVEGRGASSLGMLAGRDWAEARLVSEAEVRPYIWLAGGC